MQRRKVYRVAAAYIIAAGFIIQIGSAVFPAWELPGWAFRPGRGALSWISDRVDSGVGYGVTPQGIRATPTPRRRVASSAQSDHVGCDRCDHLRRAGFFLLPRVSARKIDKSIAVLPFQSLSDEKENAYFADGMQDDILTNLSKIGDLKVISRVSVMSYRGDGHATLAKSAKRSE